jgi:hypothetical protein
MAASIVVEEMCGSLGRKKDVHNKEEEWNFRGTWVCLEGKELHLGTTTATT